MKYIIKESQYRVLLKEIKYDPDVANIQQILVDKGYDLGNYGPKGDGVDGKFGPLTKLAYEKEFGQSSEGNELKGPERSYDAILVGGLDNRAGDKDIDTQVELLKMGLGQNKKVKGFRFNTPVTTVINFIKNNRNAPVYLFSAGCRMSDDIADSMGSKKNKLFIIEPYAAGQITKANVRRAVSGGVPPSNVFVGNSIGRGKGIVDGASPSGSSSHWGALTTVASKTRNS